MSDLRDQLQQVLGDTYQLERELAGGMSRAQVATYAGYPRAALA